MSIAWKRRRSIKRALCVKCFKGASHVWHQVDPRHPHRHRFQAAPCSFGDCTRFATQYSPVRRYEQEPWLLCDEHDQLMREALKARDEVAHPLVHVEPPTDARDLWVKEGDQKCIHCGHTKKSHSEDKRGCCVRMPTEVGGSRLCHCPLFEEVVGEEPKKPRTFAEVASSEALCATIHADVKDVSPRIDTVYVTEKPVSRAMLVEVTLDQMPLSKHHLDVIEDHVDRTIRKHLPAGFGLEKKIILPDPDSDPVCDACGHSEKFHLYGLTEMKCCATAECECTAFKTASTVRTP